MKFRDQVPNFITLLNLLSGSVAIVLAFSGEMKCASWFILAAAILDFLDGFAARLLHAKSGIGAQLDSLADVISFGLAPSFIMFQLIRQNLDVSSVMIGNVPVVPFAGLLLVAAGAYRLARFNTDPGQEEEFKGLPIPAAGLFIASLPLIIFREKVNVELAAFLGNIYVLGAIIIFISWLMVSNIPMMSLKFKNLSWHDNVHRFILGLSSLVLLIFLQYTAVPMIIFLYIILSVISLSFREKKQVIR